jgi:hypothetical protein
MADGTIDTEGRADEVEDLKQAHLKKQQEGKGHWEDGLASDSESIVRWATLLKLPRLDAWPAIRTDANGRYRSRPIEAKTDIRRLTRSRSYRRRRSRLRARRTEQTNKKERTKRRH